MTSFYILNNRTRKKDLESCDGLGNIDGKVSFLRGFFCNQLFSMAESIDSKIMLWLFLRKNRAFLILFPKQKKDLKRQCHLVKNDEIV